MRALLIICLVYLITEAVCLKCDGNPGTPEAILKQKLLCGSYDKSERPVKKYTDAVVVNMHMVLQNFDVDESLKKIFINVWLRLVWKDQLLTWDPMENGGLKDLIIESDDIWLPDMMPYSAYYSNNLEASCTSPKCNLLSNGEVRCIPACDYHSLCASDFTNWPFDRMNCTLRFGMWAEYSREVDFTAGGISFISNETNSHNEWIIVSVNASKHESITLEGNDSSTMYPSVVYNFILERHSGAHCAIILTPAFVMVAINLIALWVNCCAIERLVMLCVNVFIHFLFIVNLYWQIPYNGSTVPYFLIFFRDSLIINVSLLISTVFIKHLYISAKQPPAVLASCVALLTGNPVGQWLFNADAVAYPDRNSTAEETRQTEELPDENAGDTAILVAEQDNSDSQKRSAQGGEMVAIAIVLDRLLFVLATATYIVMFLTLMPRY